MVRGNIWQYLRKQVVWITGGGSGIGRSLACAYATDGHTVVISGRRSAALEETKSLYPEFIIPIACDVTDDQMVEKVVQDILALYQRIDVVIANAGYGQSGWVQKVEMHQWRRQFDVNFFGLISTVRHSLPHVKESEVKLFLMSSVMAYVRFIKSAPYCASNLAVTAFGETLQLELRDSNAGCTIIHPGFVESEIGQINAEGTYDPTMKDRRPQHLMWTGERAARVMKRAIDKRRSHYTFTAHGVLGELLARYFPRTLLWAMKKFV